MACTHDQTYNNDYCCALPSAAFKSSEGAVPNARSAQCDPALAGTCN